MQARQGRLAAHLHDFELAHHRVALHALAQPDQAVGHGEDRVRVVLVGVFADQEGGGLPAGHVHAQLLHELLQCVVWIDVRIARALVRQHDRTERIDKHQGRVEVLHLGQDARQHHVQVTGQRFFGQVDKAHPAVNRLGIEKIELLLVTQHLQRWLAQHGEVQRRPLRRGQREHDLVRQGGFAAARRAGQQIERKLGQPDGDFAAAHRDMSCAGLPLEIGGQTVRNKRSVSEGPISDRTRA